LDSFREDYKQLQGEKYLHFFVEYARYLCLQVMVIGLLLEELFTFSFFWIKSQTILLCNPFIIQLERNEQNKKKKVLLIVWET